MNPISFILREFFRRTFGIDEAMGDKLEVAVDHEGNAHVEVQQQARGYAPTVQVEAKFK